MNQLSTQAIMLHRINYGEADRIVTLITPDQGKLRLLAKGVRRVKSKLAGGIELFSVSHITYVKGRGEIGTLTSSRLSRHFAGIAADLDRTMSGYDTIKLFDKATEDTPEQAYFKLLEQVFEALDNSGVPLMLVRLWCEAQLVSLAGHSPNLLTDTSKNRLDAAQKYNFDFDQMAFVASDTGRYDASHIKLLRLVFDHHTPQSLSKIQGTEQLTQAAAPLVNTMLHTHIRV